MDEKVKEIEERLRSYPIFWNIDGEPQDASEEIQCLFSLLSEKEKESKHNSEYATAMHQKNIELLDILKEKKKEIGELKNRISSFEAEWDANELHAQYIVCEEQAKEIKKLEIDKVEYSNNITNKLNWFEARNEDLIEDNFKLRSLESDYNKIIQEILLCNPIPASEREDDRLEPPWEVVKRMGKRIKDLEEGIEKINEVLENGKRHHKIPMIERIVEDLIEKKKRGG